MDSRNRMRCKFIIFFSILVTCFAVWAANCEAQGQITPQSIITTVAGGSWVFRGDGLPAIGAPLSVAGVTVDSGGNIIVADPANNQVVRISPAGILSVIAGNGIPGFSGEGGPATSASLAGPAGVAVDTGGNIYIADSTNYRVRKVSPDGIITTVAGNGEYGFSGDGGPATSASLTGLHAVAVDIGGSLYISDNGNNRIRRVSPDGIITTVAGNGTGGFSGDGGSATSASLQEPDDVAVDADGNLYVTGSYRVRRVSPDGIITTVAGGGYNGYPNDGIPATDASLDVPSGVVVDADGNLYICEFLSARVRKVSPDGILTTVAGSGEIGFSGDGGPATSAELNYPYRVAVDMGGSLYLADSQNLRIRKVSPDGVINTIAGNGSFKFAGDGGPATSASLNLRGSFVFAGLALDDMGDLYVADEGNSRIRKISPGGIITTVAGNGIPDLSGDGGPATSASLLRPLGVVVDASGTLYIADSANRLIRKVGTNGVITTVAGGGTVYPGDGIQATSAYLPFPVDVAVDSDGNLYIGSQANRIYKVSPDGILTTVAGTGTGGFSGDGGPATAASLNQPTGVALDDVANLYSADTGNNRIRKLNPDGIITTVAGNGTGSFSGDGGPATTASLNRPVGVALDGFGNLYIADGSNQRIRRVGPDGIITTVAGSEAFGFSGDGGPAASAELWNPTDVGVDVGGDLFIVDSSNDRIRKVWATKPAFAASPANLNFRAPSGATPVAEQRVAVLSDAFGLQWSATTATSSGGNWLTIAPSTGAAPGVIAVSVNVTSLSPGNYSGTVTMNAPLADPPVQTVAVSLTVDAALEPKLVAEPLSFNFEAQTGATNITPKTLRISNGGGGSIRWTAQAFTSGGNWMEISSSSGTVTATASSTVEITVQPGILDAGVYSGSIHVTNTDSNQTERVPVTLLIEQPTKTILVSQSGLLFNGVEGGAGVPADAFGIANIGEGEMQWTAIPTTLSGGTNWLTVSPREGSSQGGSLRVPLVDVNINADGMPAGQYHGLVRVDAFGATNSPQFVTVTLDILPPGSNPGVVMRPTGMIFAAQEGSFSPSSQTVRLSTAAPGQIEARSGLFTVNGGDWLEILPPNVVLSADDPRSIVVQPHITDRGTNQALASGVYRGQLAYSFSDGSPTQRVDILFLVVPTPVSAAVSGADKRMDGERTLTLDAGEGCTPQRLYATIQTLSDNFAIAVGWPVTVQSLVLDDCGSPVRNATVVASFSNGEDSLVLDSLGNGVYSRSWQPSRIPHQGSVAVTVRAALPPLEPAEARVQGGLSENSSVPRLYPGGVVSGASFAAGEPVVPGSIVSVFGENMAQDLNYASGLPLSTNLGGTTLNIGGIEAPLFFSASGQINAQVPAELAPNSRPSVVLRTTNPATGSQTLAVPQTITLAAARPAIFTTNQQGTGQGAILNEDYSPNSHSNPAARGSVVQIFATGLGATEPLVHSGQAAPSDPPATVILPVEVEMGGQTAVVHFAGLAPNYVGLYQVNVTVPDTVAPGPEVSLVITQGDVPSNTVTLAIQ